MSNGLYRNWLYVASDFLSDLSPNHSDFVIQRSQRDYYFTDARYITVINSRLDSKLFHHIDKC